MTTAKKRRRSTKSTARRQPASTARPAISNAAVLKATGKPWKHWFAILDRFDVKKHGHKAAAAHLHAKKAGAWWAQMIVVTYERARGLRAVHQTSTGFSVSVSRVIDAPLALVFNSVARPARRAAWLKGCDLEARSTTRHKHVRVRFRSGAGIKPAERPTPVEINFYPRPRDRCQVTVQHSRLASRRDVPRMKAFWSDAMDRLRDRFERARTRP